MGAVAAAVALRAVAAVVMAAVLTKRKSENAVRTNKVRRRHLLQGKMKRPQSRWLVMHTLLATSAWMARIGRGLQVI